MSYSIYPDVRVVRVKDFMKRRYGPPSRLKFFVRPGPTDRYLMTVS